MGIDMNSRKVVQAIFATIVKVAAVAVILVFVYKGAVKAYDFGYRIFEDKPVAEEPGRDVTVSITMGTGSKEIGKILESKGLVKDATIFYLQNLLSPYWDKLASGEYTLNTSMTAAQMMEIMAEKEPEEEEGADDD